MNFFKKKYCDICNAKFFREEELMQHKQVVHFKNALYDCRQCSKNFSNMEDMRNHLQKEHTYKKTNS